MPMNKKTFTLAVLFFCVTLVWFGVNVYWDCVRRVDVYNTLLSLLFVVFGRHGLERSEEETAQTRRRGGQIQDTLIFTVL